MADTTGKKFLSDQVDPQRTSVIPNTEVDFALREPRAFPVRGDTSEMRPDLKEFPEEKFPETHSCIIVQDNNDGTVQVLNRQLELVTVKLIMDKAHWRVKVGDTAAYYRPTDDGNWVLLTQLYPHRLEQLDASLNGDIWTADLEYVDTDPFYEFSDEKIVIKKTGWYDIEVVVERTLDGTRVIFFQAPEGGIPPMVGGMLGRADCDILESVNGIISPTGQTVHVFNWTRRSVCSIGSRYGHCAAVEGGDYHVLTDDCSEENPLPPPPSGGGGPTTPGGSGGGTTGLPSMVLPSMFLGNSALPLISNGGAKHNFGTGGVIS